MSASSTASEPASTATASAQPAAGVSDKSAVARFAPRLLGTRARWISLGIGVLVVLAFWLLGDDAWLGIANSLMVYALATLSINVLSGYTGQVSLGAFFFMGIGGFTAAILSAPPQTGPDAQLGLGLPFYVWIPAAGIVAALAGALVGPVALRVKGFYLGIVTLALLNIGYYIITHLPANVGGGNVGRFLGPITIGDFSFSAPEPPYQTLLGILTVTDHQAYFALILLILGVSALFVTNVMRSRAGRAMQAVRDNETAAAIMGVNVFQVKMGAFIFSSFLAGVAGALYASSTLAGLAFWPAPPDYGLVLSIEIVAAMIVGGIASVWGSILGAAFVFAIPLVLNEFTSGSVSASSGFILGSIKIGIFGVLIMVFLLFEPAGVVGLFRRGRFRRPRFALRRQNKGGEAAQPPA